MERAILHSDMNCFYASVEMLHHPEFADTPLAVGGNPEKRHGIILTANYPAKRRGVKTGMALWQAKQVCPELNIVPPHMDQYLRFSRLTHEIYTEYTDRCEPFGIDESWLDVTDSASVRGSPLIIAEEIRRRVRKELGLTVSIGISWNKIFAKFGSDYKKPDSITEITKENYKDLVWTSPASDLLYVGRATIRKLNRIGIQTIGELAECDPAILSSLFGKMGLILWIFANGEDETPVAEDGEENPIKSIGNSTTTPRDLVNDRDVKTVIYLLSESVASRLRDNHFAGKTIGISIRDNGLFSFMRQKRIRIPTQMSDEIAGHAMDLFSRNYRWEQPIRSIGVRVSDLSPDTYWYQTDLFTNELMREKYLKIDTAVDNLRKRYGYSSILRGIMYYDRVLSGLDAKAEDHMVHPHSYFEKGNHVMDEEGELFS